MTLALHIARKSEGRPDTLGYNLSVESYYRLQAQVDIDNAGKLRSDLLELVNAGSGDVIVDCVNLEFIDSIGVAVMGQVGRLLAVHDRELRLINMSPQARRPFDLLGHNDYFGLSESGDAAGKVDLI